MEYIVFDTETTGLPRSWSAPVTKLDNWPRLVQLAWVLYNEAGEELQRCVRIVRPDGFTIHASVVRVHGITNQIAMSHGVPLRDVVEEFCAVLRRHKVTLVAHNIAFDEKIIGAELLRLQIQSNFFNLPKICTMKSAAEFCNLPGKKYPRLAELHYILFQNALREAHRADIDALTCGKCFFELKKKQIINL